MNSTLDLLGPPIHHHLCALPHVLEIYFLMLNNVIVVQSYFEDDKDFVMLKEEFPRSYKVSLLGNYNTQTGTQQFGILKSKHLKRY